MDGTRACLHPSIIAYTNALGFLYKHVIGALVSLLMGIIIYIELAPHSVYFKEENKSKQLSFPIFAVCSDTAQLGQ